MAGAASAARRHLCLGSSVSVQPVSSSSSSSAVIGGGSAAVAPAAAPRRGHLHPHRHRPARGGVAARASADEDAPRSGAEQLGPDVAAGIRDVQDNLAWRPATVTRNEACSLDGSQRLLHLSVSDDVRAARGVGGRCGEDEREREPRARAK